MLQYQEEKSQVKDAVKSAKVWKIYSVVSA